MKKITWALGVFALLTSTVAQAQTVPLGKASTFKAKSSTAQSYEWTFPGGVVINGKVVQYTFTQAGPQEVKLRVEGFEGNTNEISKRVLVANVGRPTAVIESSIDDVEILRNTLEADLSQSIKLSSNSFFEEKTDDDLSKIWTVNGRSVPESELSNVFDTIGNYQVVLTVQDPTQNNARDQDTLQVRIVNQAPIVSALEATDNGSGQITLSATAEDVDGAIGSYKFEVLEAGQVVQVQLVSNPQTVFDLSRFAGDHEYSFRVEVTDDRFATASFVSPTNITVSQSANNQAPVVQINALPGNQGVVGEQFNFSAQATDADNDNLRFEWILSTGQRFYTPQFITTFNEVGSYEVQLNVSDGIDLVTDTLTVSVQNAPGVVVNNEPPEASITGVLPSNTGFTSSVFRLYAEASDPNLDRLRYEWDFGDGTKSFTRNAAILYAVPGSYNVVLTVSDGELSVSDTVTLTVEEGPELAAETLAERETRLAEERDAALVESLERQGDLTPEQVTLITGINSNLTAQEQAALNAQGELDEAQQTLVDQINERLTAEEKAALDAQGKLREDQQAKVDNIDTRLQNLIKASEDKNQEAKDEAAEDLEDYRDDLDGAIDVLEAARALDETLEEASQRLVEEQKSARDNALELRNQDRTLRQQRLDGQLQTLESTIAQLEAAKAQDETLEQAAVRLQQEQRALKSQAESLRSQGLAEEASRLEARRTDMQLMIDELEAAKAQGETLEQVAVRLTEAQAEKKLQAETLQKEGRDLEAEQFEARQQNLSSAIAQLEAAQKEGETLEQAALRLQAQADTAKLGSQEFNEAARVLEAQRLLDRQSFLSQQVADLEEARNNPQPLNSGINRPGQESLEDRIARLQDKSDKASFEATERQRLAAELAVARQQEVLVELAKKQQQFDDEVDEAKRAVIEVQIEELEQEIERLERIMNPETVLTAAQIQARNLILEEEAGSQKSTVISEQQEYLATRLAEIEAQLALVQDEKERERLKVEQKRIKANLDQTELLVDYREQLLNSKNELNQRLAGDLNSTTELLVRTQLDSIEAKLKSVERFDEINREIKDFADLDNQNPADLANTYLEEERAALEKELNVLRVRMAQTDDEITLKALGIREKELKEALARLPLSESLGNSIESLPVVKAMEYLKHYERVLSVEEGALEVAKQSKVEEALALLRRLDNSGYTPQTRLSELLADLERRETELLNDYRKTTDAGELEALRDKLVVLGEARDQLGSLDRYQVELNDSVYNANEKLSALQNITRKAYLEADSPAKQAVATQALNSLVNSQRWLQRFYRPTRREQIIADLESTLAATSQEVGQSQAGADLVLLRASKPLINEAIEAQVKTDFENFKANLEKQSLTISDESEKAALKERIDALSYEELAAGGALENTNLFAALLADLTINTNTNLFLYADTPLTEHNQALLFEWDLGDGEKRFGQNINHEYHEPGFYRVVLTLSDGVTSEQDLFTIRVLSPTD